MNKTEQELLKTFHEELIKLAEIAQRLDAFNPELPGAFTGTPSERISRQLEAYKIPGF